MATSRLSARACVTMLPGSSAMTVTGTCSPSAVKKEVMPALFASKPTPASSAPATTVQRALRPATAGAGARHCSAVPRSVRDDSVAERAAAAAGSRMAPKVTRRSARGAAAGAAAIAAARLSVSDAIGSDGGATVAPSEVVRHFARQNERR